MRRSAIVLIAALSLSACGGTADSGGEGAANDAPTADANAPADEDPADDTVGDEGAPEEDDTSDAGAPGVELLADGFGQRDEYVQGIAIVTSNDESTIGEFVTVSMNFLDESGSILSTVEQVESLSWVGQELVLPVWMGASEDGDVASVETSVSVSDYGGAAAPELPPLAALDSQEITEDEYGGVTATFEMSNDGDSDLENLRVGVVCYADEGEILGGASDYPGLLAAGQTIRLDVDVTVTSMPAECKAFPNYGM